VEAKHKKHAASDITSKKSSKSTSAQQTFTMVLVEGTKAVARGEYRKPNASKCVLNVILLSHCS
jgi:hypothetical protein